MNYLKTKCSSQTFNEDRGLPYSTWVILTCFQGADCYGCLHFQGEMSRGGVEEEGGR